MSIIIVLSSHTRIGAWLGKQENVGEKSTSILYNMIDCHARISHKHRIHEKLGLQLSLLHYI